jgi:hypothetical protein
MYFLNWTFCLQNGHFVEDVDVSSPQKIKRKTLVFVYCETGNICQKNWRKWV